MTCIVGLVSDGKIYMGGDSASVSGWDLIVRADEKVFRNDGFLMGFTSSFRMGQLLRYSFNPPTHPDNMDLMRYMATIFVDSIRQCLKDGGFAKKQNEVESGGNFLIGYKGRLFQIENDYQVALSRDKFDAVGCGASYALGSLYSTPKMTPLQRIKTALQCAENFSAGVRAPFKILSLI